MFAITLTLVIPLVLCANEGNIHLLEEEISEALRSCSLEVPKTRQRRSNNYTRIDGNKENHNQYYHERRNNSQENRIHVLNGTDYDYLGFGAGDVGEKYIKTLPRPALNYNNNSNDIYRNKRDFLSKNTDQCLSQCVFANLQVIDSRGIPREPELWNKLQSSLNSQQTSSHLKDQVHECFLELESESEENSCSYSHKLERCLMLRISDRKANVTKTTENNNE
ncbi:odorant-binding protein 59a-like [Pieris rapae]|uniref:odorant-binding protein 59a-like n=1 Tax=Pieris rapae TaxID=64459 RepID=UPI001E279FF4|nr:odorant-binding protein 59a-like [Pieris rapae]